MSVATHTLAALERVKVKHPFAASGDIAPSAATDARTSEIWNRLRALEGDRLRNFVTTLRTTDVRLACYGASPILAEDGVVERLAVVLELRGEAYFRRSPVAWIAYLLSDGDRRFSTAARTYLGTRPDIPNWHALSAEERPLSYLKQEYLDGTKPFEEWWASPRVALGRYHILERVLLRRLLTDENADALLARETAGTIDRWLNIALSERERVEWHGRYVAQSDAARWRPTDPFLERVLDRYRTPNDGHSFWEAVPEARRRAFIRWLRDRELTSLLGEGERVHFWRRFLTDVERSVESMDGAAVFIIFPTWFAVQFKETGKATFMFSRNHVIAVRRLAEAQLYRYVLEHHSLGRYTHQGGVWQYNAQREVRRVMEAQSQK